MPRSFAFILVCLAIGCEYPRDAGGTFRRVRHDVIRAGVVRNHPWVDLNNDVPTGIEPQLLQRLAELLNAKINWTIGSETMLVEQLEARQLDVVIGGMTNDTPWSDRIGMSQWYVSAIDPIDKKKRKHVWAVMPGESRWLLEIDRFLENHRDEARSLLAEAQGTGPDKESR
jgi:polar amino acid transport system substrate-binding protein